MCVESCCYCAKIACLPLLLLNGMLHWFLFPWNYCCFSFTNLTIYLSVCLSSAHDACLRHASDPEPNKKYHCSCTFQVSRLALLCYIVLCCAMLNCIVLYCVVLSHIVLCCVILCCAILYCAVHRLHYT